MTDLSKEKARLDALRRSKLLDTPAEEAFDRLTRLAANALNAEIALVSLIDHDRQWFKSRVGLDVESTPRDVSFCTQAIESDGPFIVLDAKKDPRFSENPLVVGEPNISFYAGIPLVTGDGHSLGTLCVIDSKPREDITPREVQMLEDLAQAVMIEIHHRSEHSQLKDLTVINEELRHRMGNMYAHISSLVSMIGRSETDSKTLVTKLRGKLSSLGQVHGLVSINESKGIPVVQLVESVLWPLIDESQRSQVRFGGDRSLLLSAKGCFSLSLLLNELCTNAIKHGALDDENGQVVIAFEPVDDKVRVRWTETLQRDILVTSSREGFGTTLLKRIVPADLRGSAMLDMRQNGIEYTLDALSEILLQEKPLKTV